MLKNISNLGKTLNKAEQKEINGGKSIIGAGAYCSCSYPNGDGWEGTIGSCDRCAQLCVGGQALCVG